MKRREFLWDVLSASALPFMRRKKAQEIASETVNVWQSGVYQMDTLVVPTGEVWEAAQGARVIITRANGFTPNVEVNGTLRNIWVGGTRDEANCGNCFAGDNSVWDGVTLFGYWQGINAGSHINPQIINSRLVNCGGGLLSHPIYINNFNAIEGQGATIEDNIFVGGEGYPIHLYHSPNWNSVRRNFVGGGLRCVAVEGHHNTVRENIFWSNTDYACAWIGQDNGTSELVFNHNLFGAPTTAHWLDYPAGSVVKNNSFLIGATTFGTGVNLLTKEQMRLTYGIRYGDVRNAVDALKQAFLQAPAQLLNDATIGGNFAVLKGAVTKWVG